MSQLASLQPKGNDIVTAIPALDDSGGNWAIFKTRFRLALRPQGPYHFFVPNSAVSKPVIPAAIARKAIADLTTAEKAKKAEVEKEIAAWERARYVL
jgi:hypothetical protein